MQTGSEQLKSQQQILKSKGYYGGAVDGIWGPMTIEAKLKWERSGKFAPGIPNNGLPFPARGPFPTGVRRKSDGTLTCAEVELAAITAADRAAVVAATAKKTVPETYSDEQ